MAYPEPRYHRQETAKEYTKVYTLQSTDEIVVKQEDGMMGYISADQFAITSDGTYDPQFNDTSGSVVGVSQTGSYSLIHDVCFFRVNVDFANCTNFGTGQYQIQLPFPVDYKTTLRGGTLHQTSGSAGGTSYNITGLSAETGSTSTLLLYYTGTTSYLNWKFNTPVSASTTSSHFDINGTYQISQ
jgi:hypothetical protein